MNHKNEKFSVRCSFDWWATENSLETRMSIIVILNNTEVCLKINLALSPYSSQTTLVESDP